MKWRFFLAVVIGVVAIEGSWASGQTTNPAPGARPALPLTMVKRQPTSEPSEAQLSAAFLFGRSATAKEGFNAVTLPFHFSSKDSAGDAAEALAFSFLLSHAMDWSPGCYCARHAYFVFKRDRESMEPLVREYKPALIAGIVKEWSATHAIGGQIEASKDGYTGKLVIYDANAGVAFEKPYAKPEDFFDLLGDMTVDAMTFLDQVPGKELAERLHVKQCNDHQSLIDLGHAAFMDERTDEEFGLYKKILDRDPNFATVRLWWANQKQWGDNDRQAYYRQICTALDSYAMPVLWELPEEVASVPNFAARYQGWLATDRKLEGNSSPHIVRIDLDAAVRAGADHLPAMGERVRSAGGEYANEYWLLVEAADAMAKWHTLADADAAGGMYLQAMRSSFLTGTGDRFKEKQGLVDLLREVGRSDWSAGLALKMGRGFKDDGERGQAFLMYYKAGLALMQLAQYKEATEAFAESSRLATPGDSMARMMSDEGAAAMALSGQRDRLCELIAKRPAGGGEFSDAPMWRAYLDLLDGKRIDANAVWNSFKRVGLFDVRFQTVLYAQASYVNDSQAATNDLMFLVRWDPGYRPGWYLFDAYDRRWPRADSASFYDAVEWLYPEDPWVKQAVADFHKRTPKGTYTDANALLKELRGFPAARWPEWQAHSPADARTTLVANMPPGTVAVAVRRLMEQKEYAKAYELAFRFHGAIGSCAVATGGPMQANHLIYLVEQQAPAVKGTKFADPASQKQ